MTFQAYFYLFYGKIAYFAFGIKNNIYYVQNLECHQ